jgi:DNA-binding NarL/FixJ family response regulator
MNVLLIDDQALFREGVAFLLATALPRAEILQGGTAEQAIRKIGERDDLDLALIDLNLPDASGLELIATLRSRCAQLAIVALSSSDDPRTVVAALEAGAMGFIAKQESAAAFAAAIDRVIAKGIYLPDSFMAGFRELPSPEGRDRAPRTSPCALGLTRRQAAVLYRILQGNSLRMIAQELSIPSGSVRSCMSKALRVLNATTRTQAIVAAARLGLTFERMCA